jgi:hypothetical protein
MTSQAAYAAEKAIGHGDNAIIQQDVSNYAQTGDQSETMKALVWQAKQKVEIGMSIDSGDIWGTAPSISSNAYTTSIWPRLDGVRIFPLRPAWR